MSVYLNTNSPQIQRSSPSIKDQPSDQIQRMESLLNKLVIANEGIKEQNQIIIESNKELKHRVDDVLAHIPQIKENFSGNIFGATKKDKLLGDDADDYRVKLDSFLKVDTFKCVKKIGCQPIFMDVSRSDIQNVYDTSDQCFLNHFDDMCSLAKQWEEEFAKSKESEPWMNVRFGIRDKRTETHRNKDQKFYLQFCREYGDWVLNNKLKEVEKIPSLESLLRQMLVIEEKCQKKFVEKANEMLKIYSNAEKLFYNYNGERRVPISMRVISYENEKDFSVSPHFDKAAMTLLLPSDDDLMKECLIVAPADGKAFDPEKLRRPTRPVPNNLEKESCALFITGSMLEQIGVPIPATPHAVLPHDRELRHVLVAFCNVPNIDTTHLNFSIVYKKKMADDFEKRFD